MNIMINASAFHEMAWAVNLEECRYSLNQIDDAARQASEMKCGRPGASHYYEDAWGISIKYQNAIAIMYKSNYTYRALANTMQEAFGSTKSPHIASCHHDLRRR